MGGKVGAPKGGRVHWLIWNLTDDLKRAYTVRFDYSKHNYALLRYPHKDERQKPLDVFLIVRTCRTCFRVTYYNFETNYFECFNAKTSTKAVQCMQAIFERASSGALARVEEPP